MLEGKVSFQRAEGTSEKEKRPYFAIKRIFYLSQSLVEIEIVSLP
jgi:hypothetical protein